MTSEAIQYKTTYRQTYMHTPEEGRNDAGVNEWEERWEAVPLPLATAFWLCCKCFLHPETHGHRTAGVTQHKASSQLHRKNGLLTRTTSLSEEVMLRLKSITVMEWTQQKQIADTKINIGNVWLHSKLVPFLFLRSTCDSFIFFAFLCVSYLLPAILYILCSEEKDLYNFLSLFLSFIYSRLEFPGLPSLLFHLIHLVSWKIFSSLLPTGLEKFLHPITNSMQQTRRASQPRYLQK